MKCSRCKEETHGDAKVCEKCGAHFPFICNSCGKVYLDGDHDGFCTNLGCMGAYLDPLYGFVSYRRTYISRGNDFEPNTVALDIKHRLETVLNSRRIRGGFFIDKSGIESEDFDVKISRTIEACAGRVFLLILTPGALDPQKEENDWVRKEIQLAKQFGLEIIPIRVKKYLDDEDFTFPQQLPEEIGWIQKRNLNLTYFGNLEEHHLNNDIILISKEVERALAQTLLAEVTTPEIVPNQPKPASLGLPDKPSIAVLPLDNMSSDPEQEYFSDGLTEDIITDLSKVSGLFVIARNSSFVYKKQSIDLRRVGAELGVKYVLEGSVRKGGERLRINVQLIEAATGNHIWAERYDRVLTDIFEVQDEMTRTIVDALEVKLTKREQVLIQERGTDNLEAYDLMMRGRQLYYRFSKDAVSQARQLFYEAIKVDPNYALAYALVAHTLIYDFIAGFVPYNLENLELALPFAKKAIEIDGNCARGYTSLGWYYIWHRQPAEGVAQLHKAAAIEPNSDYVYIYLSYGYSVLEQGEEAISFATQALRLNPSDVAVAMHALGLAQFTAGKMEEAIQSGTQSISQNPNFLPAHMSLAVCYERVNQHQEAEHHAQEIRRLSPNFKLGMCNFYLPETKTYQLLNDALAALGFSSV